MSENYQDVKIKCQDCGIEFIFSVAEQKWYEEKGFTPPKRCRYCRNRRKNEQIQRERRNNYGYKKENY